MDDRIRIIEDSLGVGISELTFDNENTDHEKRRRTWREVMDSERLAILDSRLAMYYAEHMGATAPPSELHPALFESEMYYNFGALALFGPPQPPAVISENLRQTLLYAHGVVLYDPLFGIARGGAPNQRLVVMRGALQFWHEFGDLVESGVIRLEPPDYQLFPRVLEAEESCLDLICESQDGRRALVELFDELNVSFTGRSVDWVGRPDQPARLERARAEKFRKHLALVELSSQNMFHAVRLDLSRFLFSQLMPSADLWVPSEQHLAYYMLLAQYGLGHLDADLEATLMQGLATVYLPGLSNFSARDVVNLRRDSEVLEQWRQSLRETLAELMEMTRRGLGEGAMQRQLRNHMDVRNTGWGRSRSPPACSWPSRSPTS